MRQCLPALAQDSFSAVFYGAKHKSNLMTAINSKWCKKRTVVKIVINGAWKELIGGKVSQLTPPETYGN
jgi:hypothetical protein